MAKRFSTVSVCPWCGSIPSANSAACSCGVVLPKCSDFEFGVKYADTSKDDVRSKFGNLCQSAVDGDETAVKKVLLGNAGLCDPEAWIGVPDGVKIISEIADKGFKWGKYCLGYFFFHGVAGLKKDVALSKTLMLSAGRTKEDPITCSKAFQHLCMCRFDGVGGFDRDVDKAMYWLLKLRNSNISLYYKTLCEVLNRTDLCSGAVFVTGEGVLGWPTDWKAQKTIAKKVFKAPKAYVMREGEEKSVDLFTFGSQMDMRQFNCLLEEATNAFKKKKGKSPFGKLEKLPSEYRTVAKVGDFGLRGSYSEQLGNTLNHADRNYLLCFDDYYYWDDVVFDTHIPVDHFLFGDLARYIEMISEAKYRNVDDYGTRWKEEVFDSSEVKLLNAYFRFVRRYILNDRKGGVKLWDGSIQTAINSSSCNISVD